VTLPAKFDPEEVWWLNASPPDCNAAGSDGFESGTSPMHVELCWFIISLPPAQSSVEQISSHKI
jgi:hypothetical protein